MLFGKNRDSEIGLWLPNCTRCARTILLTTANFSQIAQLTHLLHILIFEELNFRVFREFGETAKFMHQEIFLNLLLGVTSSSRWALAGLLSI